MKPGVGELLKAVLIKLTWAIAICKYSTQKHLITNNLKQFAKQNSLVNLADGPKKSDAMLKYERESNLPTTGITKPAPTGITTPKPPPPAPTVPNVLASPQKNPKMMGSPDGGPQATPKMTTALEGLGKSPHCSTSSSSTVETPALKRPKLSACGSVLI